MKKLFAILSIVVMPTFASPQTKHPPCICPSRVIKASGKPDEFFNLGNGRIIALCGSVKKTKKDTIAAEFILYRCGRKDIIEEWDGQDCKISQRNDTLIVTETGGMPVGKDFKFV